MTERTFYLSEFFRFFFKRKKILFYAGGVGFLLTLLFACLFSRSYFLAEASFRQVQNQLTDTNSVQTLLKSMWTLHEHPHAISVMQSKKLLSKVVEELGLQIEEIGYPRLLSLFCRELQILFKRDSFLFCNVKYKKEKTESFFIRPLTEATFEVLDQKKKKILEGKLHEPVVFNEGSWTLVKMPDEKKIFSFRFIPKRTAISKIQKKLKIKKSRKDDSLLLLQVQALQRETAIGILNAVMKTFQDYLCHEQEELASAQLRYLQKRRDQLEAELDETLNQYAAYLQNALGTEGFLGLSQEIEMLSEPKEKYLAQKHQMDLEIKKWKQPTQLEATARHPWKEGIEKKDTLDWQITQITPSDLFAEELSGIDLETTQKLHAGYSEELDHLSFYLEQLKECLEKISESDFAFSVLSQVLKDPVSQNIIQKGAEISLQLADKENRSEKERGRLRAAYATQKIFLQEHIEKKIDVLTAEYNQIEKKMACLEQKALDLLQKERGNVEQKLAEIGAKMAELPEKWRLESRLKLKKELTMQILEGITQLSESKLVNHHLFQVESKPLDQADSPLDIEPPHLFLFASLGGIVSIFFVACGLLVRSLISGFPLSFEYLCDQNFQVGKSKEELFQRMAFALQPGETIALIGNDWKEEFALFLQNRGFSLAEDAKIKQKEECKILHTPNSASTPEALHFLSLSDRFLLQIKDEKAEDLVPFAKKKGLCLLIE